MTIKYLKKSPKTSSTDDTKTREIVEGILKEIEKTKEDGCIEVQIKYRDEASVEKCLTIKVNDMAHPTKVNIPQHDTHLSI